MAERKLPSRRKRAPKGKVIRISNMIYDLLNAQRKGKSWDSLFRRMLGVEDREGNQQPLIEGMLETVTGKFFLKGLEDSWETLEESAYETAIMAAAKMKMKRVSKPLKMRELP